MSEDIKLNEEASVPEADATTVAAEPAASQDAAEAENLSAWQKLKILFGASRAFWLLNLANFGDGVAYFGILTLLALFLGHDIGLSDSATGITISTFTGLVTLFIFGGGFVSDWLGVRKALIISTLIITLGRVLLAFCPSFHGIGLLPVWVALFLMALGGGLLEPTLYSGVKEFTDPRTASIGFGLIYSLFNLGIVAENFLSPYIRTAEPFLKLGGWEIKGLGWGIEGVFACCAGITVLILLVLLCCFTPKVEREDREKAVKAFAAEAARKGETVKAEEPQKKFSWSEKLAPFKNCKFMFFIFILLPVRTLFAHQWLTLPDYVTRCYPAAVGAKFEWITGINPLIIVIFVPLFAILTSKVKVVDMMLIGTSVSALTTLFLVPGPDLTRLLLYVVVFSLGEALWSSRFLEYVATLAPRGQVGAYMGLAELPWFLAKFTTGLYSGFMLEKFIPKHDPSNSQGLWALYAVIALISPVGLLLSRKWLLKDDNNQAAA